MCAVMQIGLHANWIACQWPLECCGWCVFLNLSHHRTMIQVYFQQMHWDDCILCIPAMQNVFIVNQPNIPPRNAKAIRTLVDTTHEAVHMINRLGADTTKWDPILVHIVSHKLDSYTQQLWKERLKATKELIPFDELLEFLEIRAQVLEEVNPQTQGNNKNMNNQQKTPARIEKWQAKAHITKSHSCPFCKQDHLPFRCDEYLKMDIRSNSRKESLLKLLISGSRHRELQIEICMQTKG